MPILTKFWEKQNATKLRVRVLLHGGIQWQVWGQRFRGLQPQLSSSNNTDKKACSLAEVITDPLIYILNKRQRKASILIIRILRIWACTGNEGAKKTENRLAQAMEAE